MSEFEKENNMGRAIPYDNNAEKAVLCSFLIDNTASDKYLNKLNKEDFYVKRHRVILEAMKSIQNDSKPIDFISITNHLTNLGKLDEVGSVTYITELTNTVPSSANIDYYVKILKEDSLLRNIIKLGNEISQAAYKSNNALEALQFVEKKIYQLSQSQSITDLKQISDACAEALDEIEKIQIGEDKKNYLKTNFPNFDATTFGLKPGEMILLAARPGIGKTAFALNIGANACLNEKKYVAMFSLEMATNELVKRLFSYVGAVSSSKIKTARGLSSPEYKKLFNAYTQLINSNFYVDDYPMNSPTDILSKCRRMQRENGLDLIIVDYLQLMEMGSGNNQEGRQQEVAKLSRKLKLLAKELGVPILVLSQMSRGVEQRNEHEPKLSDLRDSGAIEQDADMVMFLHNPSRYTAGLPEDRVQLIIAKHRNGELKTIDLEWNGDMSTFKECEVQGELSELVRQEKEKAENQNGAKGQSKNDDSIKMNNEGVFEMPKNLQKENVAKPKSSAPKPQPQMVEVSNDDAPPFAMADKDEPEPPFEMDSQNEPVPPPMEEPIAEEPVRSKRKGLISVSTKPKFENEEKSGFEPLDDDGDMPF